MTQIQPQGYCTSTLRQPGDLGSWGDTVDAVLTELIGGGPESSATLSANAFTPGNAAGPVYSLTPSAGASDTLNTITATNCRDGHVIGIRPAAGKTITIGNAGNIATCDGTTPALSGTMVMFFKYKASIPGWEEVAATSNCRTIVPATTNSTSADLGADVTMTTANTIYDGPSVTIGAGTWMLIAQVAFRNASGACSPLGLIRDSLNNVYAQSAGSGGAANQQQTVVPMALVSPTGSTTYKVSGISNVASTIMEKVPWTNDQGIAATRLVAIRLY